MKLKVLMPWKNLGCLGFVIGRFYFDIYRASRWCLGFYCNTGKRKIWGRLLPFPRILKVEDWSNDVFRIWRRGRGWRVCP
jgi:hypothetical protein